MSGRKLPSRCRRRHDRGGHNLGKDEAGHDRWRYDAWTENEMWLSLKGFKLLQMKLIEIETNVNWNEL